MKRKTHLRRIDDLTAGFDALLSLEDGWLDGNGVAPDKTELVFVARKMAAHYLKRLPVPAILPTPEGNLLFEWDLFFVFRSCPCGPRDVNASLNFIARTNDAADRTISLVPEPPALRRALLRRTRPHQ